MPADFTHNNRPIQTRGAAFPDAEAASEHLPGTQSLAPPLFQLSGMANTGSAAPVVQRHEADQLPPAIEGGDIATYQVDQTGSIQALNLNKLAALVHQAFTSAPYSNTYLRISGRYPAQDAAFDPSLPAESLRYALIQWIGSATIPNIASRIITDSGLDEHLPPQDGGILHARLQHFSRVISPGIGGPPEPKHPSPATTPKTVPAPAPPAVEAKVPYPKHDEESGSADYVYHEVEIESKLPGGPIKSFTITVPVKVSGVTTIEFSGTVFKRELDSIKKAMNMKELVFKVAVKGEVDPKSPLAAPKFGLFTGVEGEYPLFASPFSVYGSAGVKGDASERKPKVEPTGELGLKFTF